MKKINKNDINLYDTITCGQIFRYYINDNKYTVILNDRVVELYEDDKFIYINSSNEKNVDKIVSNYLDLNRNYEEIEKQLIKNDKSFSQIIDKCKGFKIINQFPFETMISYIISANNNVRNIQRSVNLLSKLYGEKIEFNKNTYYLFPTLEQSKRISIDDLNKIGLGFRSKYIYDFMNNISNSDIENINKLNTKDALEYLLNFKGIGLKIASCILLFAYSRLDVFPIDTWVRKYMKDTYDFNDIKKIKDFAKEKYGDYSGLAIQYMFHSKRNKRN